MKQVQNIILEVLKVVSVLLVVIFVVSQLSTGKESNTDISDMAEAVIAVSDTSEMLEADNQMIKRLYGINPVDYEGVVLYYPTTNMGAAEILIVKLKEVSQQESVTAAIESRVDSQINVFDGYGVEQTEMLNNAVTEVEGNYVMLVVGKDTAPAVKAFREKL